jgi:hypothetical protein
VHNYHLYPQGEHTDSSPETFLGGNTLYNYINKEGKKEFAYNFTEGGARVYKEAG